MFPGGRHRELDSQPDGWDVYLQAGLARAVMQYPKNCAHVQNTFNQTSLVLRNKPRKIIQAFPFNMEFEMLELRFLELKDVVDVYLILESNFSASGSAKELHLLNRLKAGMYPEVANKIVHVFLDYFPKGADKNGWITDGLHRNHLGSHGLPKISGWEWDDLFVMTDADELPCREALQFLKWHDGYSEPVGFILSWTAYGFFWRSDDGRGQGWLFRNNHETTTLRFSERSLSNTIRVQAHPETGIRIENISQNERKYRSVDNRDQRHEKRLALLLVHGSKPDAE